MLVKLCLAGRQGVRHNANLSWFGNLDQAAWLAAIWTDGGAIGLGRSLRQASRVTLVWLSADDCAPSKVLNEGRFDWNNGVIAEASASSTLPHPATPKSRTPSPSPDLEVQAICIHNGLVVVGVNNGWVWGGEVGLVGTFDPASGTYTI